MPKRKVNVLLVASSLWMGGAEMVVRHLAETIDRSRFNVTVCHLKQRGIVGDQIASLGIDIVGAGGETPPKVDYFTALKLLRVMKRSVIAIRERPPLPSSIEDTPRTLIDPRPVS